MNQRGFSLISIIIAVILFLALGRIAYQVTSKQNQKVQKLVEENIILPSQPPQPTPKIDEADNWKTYRSLTLNISFNYPSNWNVIGDVYLENKPGTPALR